MTLEEVKQQWIGKEVEKISGKPFKYGGKIGTVIDVQMHEPWHPSVIAFKIKEDNTLVEAWRCKLSGESKKNNGPYNLNQN